MQLNKTYTLEEIDILVAIVAKIEPDMGAILTTGNEGVQETHVIKANNQVRQIATDLNMPVYLGIIQGACLGYKYRAGDIVVFDVNGVMLSAQGGGKLFNVVS